MSSPSLSSDNEDDLTHLEFPQRPSQPQFSHQTECDALGLPADAHVLLNAAEQSLYHISRVVYDMNTGEVKAQTIFETADITVPQITNVLAHMEMATVKALIRNEFHLLLKDDAKKFKLPAQFQPAHFSTAFGHDKPSNPSWPLIYVIGLSGAKGQLPTIGQIQNVLNMIERYATKYHKNDHNNWRLADAEAKKIDEHPGDADHKWTQTATAKDAYMNVNNVPVPHPRRFCRNEGNRQNLLNFVTAAKERLRVLQLDPVYHNGAEMPWTFLDVGWSSRPLQRRTSHDNHTGANHVVKNLLDTCMQIEAPKQKFFMRMLHMVHVPDPPHARVAEHALSLLCSGYVAQGGIITTLGGAGVETSASKSGKDGWANNLKVNLKQGVFQQNHIELGKRLERDVFLHKFAVPQSELEPLKAAMKQKKTAQDQADDELAELEEKCGLYNETRLNEYKGYDKLMKTVEAGEKLLELDKLAKRLLAQRKAENAVRVRQEESDGEGAPEGSSPVDEVMDEGDDDGGDEDEGDIDVQQDDQDGQMPDFPLDWFDDSLA